MRFQGNAVYAMVVFIVGAVLNIGLDPLLIFVFDMGISGAAWATSPSQICSFLCCSKWDSRGTNIRIRFNNFTLKRAYLKSYSVEALHFVVRGLASLSTIFRRTLQPELMEMQPLPECLSLPVSVCLSTLFVIGFAEGFQPVCGFNYGAGDTRFVYAKASGLCQETGSCVSGCFVAYWLHFLPRPYRGSAMIRMYSKRKHVPCA